MAEIEELDSELFPLGSSPLHIIANSEDIKSLKLLLESHASKSQVDLLDHHGRTPLAVALQNGRFDAARVLIESGASLQVGFDNTAVLAAILATAPYCPFLETLIEADVFMSLNPSLLAHLAHSAAYDGRATVLLKLLGNYEIDVDFKDNLGQTALHYASRRNNSDCVATLLKYGANIVLRNPQGSTALHLACIGGHLRVIALLLQDWVVADVAQLLNAQDSHGRTPLHIVLHYKKLEVFEYIMSNYSSCLNLALFDDTGYTIPALLFTLKVDSRFATEYKTITFILSAEEASWLLFEGVAEDNLELVNRSIASGAVVECMDHMQQTPLLLATKRGSFEVFMTLLAAGADPNATDQGRKTPLHYAYELGHLEIASHLLLLEHLDLTLFFDRYNGPLTTELLVPLIDHMTKHPSRRPKNWRKWLTLAARNVNIPINVFSQLVSVICPYDWVERLPSQQVSSDDKDISHVSQPVRQMLPLLVDGNNKDKRTVQVYRTIRSQRIPLKELRRIAKGIGGAFGCMRQRIVPYIFTSGTPKHSVGPNNKSRPFQFHFEKKAMTTFDPVHEAARHGNTAVLEYLLSNVRQSSVSLLKQLVIETRDSCGKTVAELLSQHYRAYREIIVKLSISELVMEAISYIWPLQFNYMESLLHYIVSGASLHAVGQKSSRTPLDIWPQWMFDYMKCYHEGSSELELDENGETSELLLQTLIKRVETVSITEDKGYPPVLFAAVKSGNELAVRLLLENRTAPTAKFHGRFAITQAARSCNITIVDHFLHVDSAVFLSNIPDFSEFTHDLHLGLCSLVNFGFVEAVERVITHLGLFPDSASLWQSNRSLRLLHLLIEAKSHDSLKLGDALAFDLASFLIKSKMSLRDTLGPLYDAHHATMLMQSIESFSHVFCNCGSLNVRLLLRLAKFYNELNSNHHQYAFHCLCGRGELELVSHFLTCLDSSYHAELFRSMNNHQQSPLYYAACGGHLDIVELLLDKGCKGYYPNGNPPIKGALVYFASSMPPYYSSYLELKISQTLYRKQLIKHPPARFVNHSTCTCRSIVSREELVNLLLPSTEDLEEIFSNEMYTSDIIILLAFQQSLHTVHPLLHLFSDSLERVNTSPLSLSNDCLDKAVNLMQYHRTNDSDSFDLLDTILAKLATFTAPHLNSITTAAQKGLWRLVRQVLQCPLELPDDASTTRMLSQVMLTATRKSKFDIVALVYNMHLCNREVLCRCYRPLLQAFEYGHLELSCFIKPQHALGFLTAAVKLNIVSVLEAVFSFLLSTDPSVIEDFDCLIRYCCSTNCLAVVHKYFMEPSVPIELKSEDRNQEFWFKVLLLQSSKGNTHLTLEAISSLSDVQLQSFSVEPEFRTVLGNCCYWGMNDLLECLPFEASQLLEPCSRSEPLSPWEIAMAVGHIGRLSQIDDFPGCSEALESISCDSQLHTICLQGDFYTSDKMLASHIPCIAPYFFQGVIHKLLSLQVDSTVSTSVSDVFLPFSESSSLALFYSAIKLGKFHFVKACLENFGGYAGELLDMLCQKRVSFIQLSCKRKDNVDILELLLEYLHNADRLNKHLGVSDQQSLLSSVVSLGSVSCAKLLVRWLSIDALDDQLHCQYQVRDVYGSNTGTLLHLAVLSKSIEMVDYILELLDRDAPKFCYDVNSNGHSPLSLAFSIGLTHIICYSALITEASKYRASESDQHDSIWKKKGLKTKCGWFSLLMQLNTCAISANNGNVESTEIHKNLSFSPTPVRDFQLVCMGRLFRDAAKGRNNMVISRLLFLVEKLELAHKIYLLSPEILQLLFAGGYLSDVSLKFPQESLLKVITSCGRENLLLNLLKLDCILHAGLLKQAFLYGCELNKSNVIHYFLQERDTHLLFEDTSVLKEGLARAVACGSYDTASLILLECEMHMEHKYLPPGVKLSEIIKLIYTCTSYHQLLKKFYSSLTESNCGRIPISVRWLIHGWTGREAEFIMRRLGGSNPSNPWTINLQSQMDSQEVSLSIDWESFSECLVHSPRIEEENSKFRHTPLLVEAIVFSPSVLGQICQTCSASQCFDIFSFPKATGLTSLILSSVLWPQEPSFSSLFEGQGILTLSFIPEEGVFLFPSPTSTLGSDLDDSTVSFNSSISSIVDSHQVIDQFNDLAHFTVASLNKLQLYSKKLHVSIHFSDDIMDITSVNQFTQTYASVQVILDDIVEVFKLIQKPNVVVPSYQSDGDSSYVKVPYSSHFKLPFDKVKIKFDLADRYMSYSSKRDAMSVSVADYTLNVLYILPSECDGTGLNSTGMDFHNQLPEMLISHIVGAQIQYARKKLDRSIDTVVVTNLKNHLRISGFLGSDSISLFYEDCTGQKRKLDDVENICTNLYVELEKFLILFSELFHILLYQPRLQANVRRLFEIGFKVILSDKLETSFMLKGSTPCIVVNMHQILEGMPREVLLDVFGTLINSVQGQKRYILDRSILLPMMCYIDFENSSGLLFPTVNKPGIITIQLVNHNSEVLSSLPTVNCVLNVCIVMPDGSKITATSSQEPSPRAASRQLIANAKPNGQFVVEWTPVKDGLHHISIVINGSHVKGSPFKTHTLRYGETCQRQTSAGECITFVVSHNLSYSLSSRKHRCTGSVPPIVLYKRRNFRKIITEGDVSTPLSSPTRSSSPSKSYHSLSVKGCNAVHQISMCSRYGGSRQWFHIPVGDVVVYFSPHAGLQRQSSRAKAKKQPSVNNFALKHCAMNDGFTRIIIYCRFAAVYKMFVACSKCQSVMDVIWLDQRTSLPSLLYVTPTSFSGYCSKLTSIKSGTTSTATTLKVLSTVTAGDKVCFSLKAFDGFSNPHTTGGAIHEASLSGAGQRDASFRANMVGERMLNQPKSRGVDVICCVSDKGDGTYTFDGCVFTAGTHDIVVTSVSHTSFVMGHIRVIHASPYAKHCSLELDSVYHTEPVLNKKYTMSLKMYDMFFNACDSHRVDQRKDFQVSVGQQRVSSFLHKKDRTKLELSFFPIQRGPVKLRVYVRGELLPECPLTLTVKVVTESFLKRFDSLKRYLREYLCYYYTPTLTIDRNSLLESAVNVLNVGNYFRRIVRVRFGDEPGIDTGGLAREFFHLLILECLNPQYALFQCVNGLYKPNSNSYINSNHLFYFEFFGKVLARCICDGHLSPVRFTPSLYKSLLQLQCSLEDLEIEDPTLYTGLVSIMNSESEEELEHLALSFTASQSHFGSVETVELDQGGTDKPVTLANRHEFVQKLYSWHLTDSIRAQLDNLLLGFCSIIPLTRISIFSPHELEIILCGQPEVSVSFIKRRTKLVGYSRDSDVVTWLWEVLESYSQEKLCQFLQFTTGCTSLPSTVAGEWQFSVQQGSRDPSALPQVATCFNAIILPTYPSKEILEQKLQMAIEYGSFSFGRH